MKAEDSLDRDQIRRQSQGRSRHRARCRRTTALKFPSSAPSGTAELVDSCFATAAKRLPPDPGAWTAELEVGRHCCAAVHRGQVRVRSRTGRDITARFPEL